MDTRRLNLKFFAAQIQIPLPNKYLGVEYKFLVFVEILVVECVKGLFSSPIRKL